MQLHLVVVLGKGICASGAYQHVTHCGEDQPRPWNLMQAPPEAQAMGEALLAAAEPRQRRAAAVGAHALPGDWRITPQGDLPAVVPLGGAALLGPPGACPAMEVAGSKPPLSIPAMDSSQLQASAGLP